MAAPSRIHPRELAWVGATLLVVLGAYALALARYFPDPPGMIGHDHAYFLPRLLAGAYWLEANGPFALPWFSPAFGAGLPFYANPGSAYASVPQALALALGPLEALRWTLYLFAAAGFLGAWCLARRGFGLGPAPALLAGLLYALQGYFPTRMLVGHLGYHSVMLAPWLCYFVLAPLPASPRARRWRVVRDACLGGALGAYVLQSGNFYALPPSVVAIAALAALAELAGRAPKAMLARLLGTLAFALALCAAKLAAGLAFLACFPRTGYTLPGAASVGDGLALVFRALFFDAPHEAARGRFVQGEFELGRHEWEHGVGWVALVLIGSGLALWVVRRLRERRTPTRAESLALALLALSLALPVALNVHGERWSAFLESLPLLGSSSSNLRWLVAYAPLAALAAALACERLAPARLVAPLALLAGIASIVIWLRVERSYCVAAGYSPAAIVDAWRALDAGRPPPPITEVVAERNAAGALALGRDDALASGASQLLPYEPLFGYRLEWLPRTAVVPGPALAEREGELNFQHPAAFLYPAALGRAPGSRFTLSERDELARFLAYQPLAVDWPASQRIANALNLLALCALPVLLAASLLFGRRVGRAG